MGLSFSVPLLGWLIRFLGSIANGLGVESGEDLSPSSGHFLGYMGLAVWRWVSMHSFFISRMEGFVWLESQRRISLKSYQQVATTHRLPLFSEAFIHWGGSILGLAGVLRMQQVSGGWRKETWHLSVIGFATSTICFIWKPTKMSS